MSQGMLSGAGEAAEHSSASLPVKTGFAMALLGVVGLVGLIVPEIIAVAVALVWSMSGLLHLGTTMTAVFAVIIAIPALWASVQVIRSAIACEFGSAS